MRAPTRKLVLPTSSQAQVHNDSTVVSGSQQVTSAPANPTNMSTDIASPDAVIRVDHKDGLLTPNVTTNEFQKAPTAPMSIEAMNTKAFPAPQTKYSDVEYLQQLFQSLERTLAARNRMDTAQIATQIIQSTDGTAVAALPEEAIKLFLTAADFGFNVDTSRTQEIKTDVIKNAQASQALDMLDWGDDDDDDFQID